MLFSCYFQLVLLLELLQNPPGGFRMSCPSTASVLPQKPPPLPCCSSTWQCEGPWPSLGHGPCRWSGWDGTTPWNSGGWHSLSPSWEQYSKLKYINDSRVVATNVIDDTNLSSNSRKGPGQRISWVMLNQASASTSIISPCSPKCIKMLWVRLDDGWPESEEEYSEICNWEGKIWRCLKERRCKSIRHA